MKKYNIILENGMGYIVKGEILIIDENTGQSIIYSDNNPVYTKIVAVIPPSAFVTVIEEND